MSSISEEDELERQALIDSIPEFASFENQKENILPLKGGRRAKALASLFQLSDDEKQLMIQQAQIRYEQELELLDDMDDPLDVFIRRLQWLMETFPQGDNRESKLVDFLQQVSYHFQDDPRYYSDPRYLNFWIQYSKWTIEPKEVFLYLMTKGIGQNLALFYEEYSILYEESEKYKEATDALELGIKRNAQPLGRLRRAREQLEDRIRYKKKSSSSSSMDSSILSHSLQVKNSPLPRTVLGHKPNPKIPYSIPENVYRNSSHSMPSTIPLRQAAGSNHYTTLFSSSNVPSRRPFGNENASQNQKSNFTVYVDNDTDSIMSASTSTSTSSAAQRPFDNILPSSTSTKSLSATVFSKNKQENIMPAEAYSSVTFPLASKPRIQPTFTVYRDDDESNLNQSELSTDENSQSIQSTSSYKKSAYKLVNECIDNKQHMSLMEQRFKKFAKSYIYYKNVSGQYEFIASTRECLGASGRKEPISYEELRFAKQVNRNGEAQFIKGIAAHPSKLTDNDAIIPSKIGTYSEKTKEYTTETHAAYEMINALFHKRTESELFDEEEKLDQSNDDSNHSAKKAKRIINENCEN